MPKKIILACRKDVNVWQRERKRKKKKKHLYPCYMKNSSFVLILLVTDEKERMKDKAIASCMYNSWIWGGAVGNW